MAPMASPRTITIVALSVALGLFFVFMGTIKLTPRLSKDAYNEMVSRSARVGDILLASLALPGALCFPLHKLHQPKLEAETAAPDVDVPRLVAMEGDREEENGYHNQHL